MELGSFCLGLLFATFFLPIFFVIVVSIRRMTLDGSYIKDISKKYILITGCDSGFGLLAAKQLDLLGCCVIATCLTAEGEQKLKSVLSSRANVLSMDVTKTESIQAAEKSVQQFLPTSDALWGIINNAGILRHTGAFDFDTIENMKQVADVNIWGMVSVTKTFLPYLKKSKGRIVNVGSISGRISSPGLCAYSISKYGIAAFTDCIRLELSLWGISVHLLEPGGFRTDINNKEQVFAELERFWVNAPAHIKADYRDDWFKEGPQYLASIDSYSQKLHLVTDCMQHALFSANPKKRYFPGYDSVFLWWLGLLPAEITDYMFHRMNAGTKPLKGTY